MNCFATRAKRFGDAAVKNNLIFEARFTRYKSERQTDAEMQEAML